MCIRDRYQRRVHGDKYKMFKNLVVCLVLIALFSSAWSKKTVNHEENHKKRVERASRAQKICKKLQDQAHKAMKHSKHNELVELLASSHKDCLAEALANVECVESCAYDAEDYTTDHETWAYGVAENCKRCFANFRHNGFFDQVENIAYARHQGAEELLCRRLLADCRKVEANAPEVQEFCDAIEAGQEDCKAEVAKETQCYYDCVSDCERVLDDAKKWEFCAKGCDHCKPAATKRRHH
eukprot:TRINITY_DN839_c0_g1_i1.p1 TRINITY_DN839_c0_g1~~TRINITY_DN839_c0_g1_i1.p1  ORF type:complete len:239 (-),score=77.13 TRINITY_DN839_c0_g1_i1:176-892(-)